jgi:ubiquinone/menaquinone biosynthesis C-methylase UbiE
MTSRQFEQVASHFTSEATYWDAAYEQWDVTSRIYQHRLSITLGWAAELDLPTGAKALDVGCGAGHAALGLAGGGLIVGALDASAAMAALTRRNARNTACRARILAATADAATLPVSAAQFELVVALGVLPWVAAPDRVLQEIARVLRPGGYAIVSFANRARLTYRLDPLYSQDFQPLKRPLRRVLERLGVFDAGGPEPRLDSTRASDDLLAQAGFDRVAGVTFGFGPFTVLGRPVLSRSNSIWLDHRLSRIPALRRSGSEYLVLARKCKFP